MTDNKGALTDRKFKIGQDWASVIVGFGLIIFVVMTAYKISTPLFGGKAGWSGFEGIAGMFNSSALGISLISTLVIFGVFSALGLFLSGDSLKKYFIGFIAVCLLAFLAQFLSSFTGFKELGLETVLFSLLLGLLIGNLFRLPDWLRAGVQTELFVKIGLVLLGATILFKDILTAGSFGLIQACLLYTSPSPRDGLLS